MSSFKFVRRCVVPVAAAILAVAVDGAVAARSTSRLKDIVTLQGVSAMPVVGYGLVVGLNKTGDRRQTIFSTQTLANMLSRLGVSVSADDMKVENVAAVVVTAEISPYQNVGARVDVIASSIGDARSLQGGTLLPTSLRGPDGEMTAMAQGPLSLGGFGAGIGGTSVVVNHLTAGRIPGGAIVQTMAPQLPVTDVLTFALREPDFRTASRVALAINTYLREGAARVVDPGSVKLTVPEKYRGIVPELMAEIEGLPIETDVVARVVINERTGTVVAGGDVRISPVSISHGDLKVSIVTENTVSQPIFVRQAGPGVRTEVVANTRVDVEEKGETGFVAATSNTVAELVHSLTRIKTSTRDIISILRAIKAAGALHAELVVQ
jgi:flagellar P-ring protein precursor FlgI